MSHPSKGVRALAGIALLIAAACEPVAEDVAATPDVAPARAAAPVPQAVEITTPRPDLYSERGLAGWDGRPSLGGSWIAHPDVVTAERVEVTEIATGRSLSAALFRRDPSIPGPPFQLSAEAAQTLGVVAGVPVEVDVVAVRIEQRVTAIPAATPSTEGLDPNAVVAAPEAEPIEPEPAAPAPVATEPEVPAAVPPVAAAGSAPDRPYMQVGMFGVASNATALVARLEEAGLTARAVPAGNLTRVIVGPAASAAELATIRETLRELGFTDALAVNL